MGRVKCKIKLERLCEPQIVEKAKICLRQDGDNGLVYQEKTMLIVEILSH